MDLSNYLTGHSVDGVELISVPIFTDHRGYFCETYNFARYMEKGFNDIFVQDNMSYSERSGTIRGLHFQYPPVSQSKLVMCSKGSIFDVAVDLRPGSASYGKWVGCTLSAVNKFQLYIPKGFAHGFLTLEDHAEVIYKCSDFYSPEHEGSLCWNDPEIGIDWPLTSSPILSSKDAEASGLSDLRKIETWGS